MTIETKYNIGDEVWFMNEREPTSGRIERINVEQYARMQFVKYTVMLSGIIPTSFYEQKLFPTKEELLQSL